VTPPAPVPAAPPPLPAPAEPKAPTVAPEIITPSATTVANADYPQFLGPHRNGIVSGVRLATDWNARPPRLVWKQRVGAGWSGFAVARGIAVTQEQRGDQELVVAYDLATGRVRRSHTDTARYESTVAGDGPRATPTISRGRVYTLGSTGLLNSLDLETGRRIWKREIGTENEARQPDWGRSGSPLAIDDLIVVSAGGANGRSLVAYHRETGDPVWHEGSDFVSYSSPLEATLAGVRQILILNEASVTGHDPATGRILWQYPWPGQQPTVAQPLVLSGDRVLLSAGYGVGSKLLQITGGADGGLSARLVWETPQLKAKFTNLVVRDGVVYGLDDGILVALDAESGQRRWKSGRYGHGQVILAGDLLIVQTEEGEVVLVEPRPESHHEIARFTVFTQKTWNPPALAGHFLIVRNDLEAACYELQLNR
jgi:outer membrane protein assembly factor BamB